MDGEIKKVFGNSALLVSNLVPSSRSRAEDLSRGRIELSLQHFEIGVSPHCFLLLIENPKRLGGEPSYWVRIHFSIQWHARMTMVSLS